MIKQIWKKLRSSPKLQLLTIAGSIAIISAHLSMSAMMTDVTEPLDLHLNIEQGNDFGISMISKEYPDNLTIVPGGDPVSFDPQISNDGDSDIYGFIEITLPDADFSINNVSSDWTLIKSDGERCIFAFGSGLKMERIEKRLKQHGEFISTQVPELNTQISLNENTDLEGGPYTVSAVGYAVQASINSSKPEEVWELVDGSVSQGMLKNEKEENES